LPLYERIEIHKSVQKRPQKDTE